MEWAGVAEEMSRFEINAETEPAGTGPAAMEVEDHYNLEMMIEHYLTVNFK